MRDIRELLILVRRQLVWRMLFGDNGGICGVIEDMRRGGVISIEEAKDVYVYIYNHKPDKAGIFFFRKGRIIPRYIFLTRLINELK